MGKITNQHLSDRLDCIEARLPNGEITRNASKHQRDKRNTFRP